MQKHELPFVYDAVKSLLQNAATDTERTPRSTARPASRNAALLSALFRSETNQSAFLCRSLIYELARGEVRTSDPTLQPRPEHQKSAHLHCLYGVPLLYAKPEAAKQQHRTRRGGGSKMSPWACAKVYDLRQYTENTKWGPFVDDDTDRVDWEKVEAIMLVIGSNLRKLGLTKFPVCRNFWETPFAGTWPGSAREQQQQQQPELVAAEHFEQPQQSQQSQQSQSQAQAQKDLQDRDPYGITGTWLRVVCFLDYTDFFRYNFTAGGGGDGEGEPPAHVPRAPIDYGEATRLILMKVRVTRIEPPGPDDGQALPVCHFEGISRSLDDSYDENANSDLRGMRGAFSFLA